MKILHIITGLPTAGAQIALYRLLTNIDHERFDSRVISLMDRGLIGERIEQLGIPVHCVDMKRGLPGLISLNTFHRLIRTIPAPDLVQGWEYHGNIASSLVGWWLPGKPPVLWNIRHTPYLLRDEKWSTALIIRLGKFLSGSLSRIVYNSEVSRVAHESLGYAQGRGVVLPNGFDLDEFRPSRDARDSLRAELGIAPDAFLIGTVARFHPMKDHATFLKAAGLLAQKKPGVQFLLAGEGVDLQNAALRDLLFQNGLTHNAHLLGERKDVSRLLAAMDVLTMSSAWGEGFPNIVGEAMASGVPCVVTDVGDAARIIGETGIAIPSRDPITMVKAWESLLSMSLEVRAQRGAAARHRIEEKYALHGMIKNYENLYVEASKKSCGKE
jgi:glycosyltransferase involved in cell wall biosynthesis